MTLEQLAATWLVSMCIGTVLGAKEDRPGLGLALTALLGPLGLLALFAVTGGLRLEGRDLDD